MCMSSHLPEAFLFNVTEEKALLAETVVQAPYFPRRGFRIFDECLFTEDSLSISMFEKLQFGYEVFAFWAFFVVAVVMHHEQYNSLMKGFRITGWLAGVLSPSSDGDSGVRKGASADPLKPTVLEEPIH